VWASVLMAQEGSQAATANLSESVFVAEESLRF
jgi:hypothetical protein